MARRAFPGDGGGPGRPVAARQDFLLGVAGALLAAPLAARAQQAGKVYRLGYLTVPSRESTQEVADASRAGLREFGMLDGQNVLVDYRFAEGNVDRE